ncbi:MAG TPA: hypothetical protein VIU11_06635 [Nakamurella sp.]
MSRKATMAIIAIAIAVLAAGAAAVGGSAAAAPPGPRQPIEHIAVSGAQFKVRSGNPGCFTGSGSLGYGFPVPRGALLTGATVYYIDSSTTGSVYGELSRHDLTSGATHLLATKSSGAATTGTGTLELAVDPGHLTAAAESVNLAVSVSGGVCFKGAEVHYIAKPDPATTDTARVDGAPTNGIAPDGGPATAG